MEPQLHPGPAIGLMRLKRLSVSGILVVCRLMCKSAGARKRRGGHGKRLIVEIDLEPVGRANHDHEGA